MRKEIRIPIKKEDEPIDDWTIYLLNNLSNIEILNEDGSIDVPIEGLLQDIIRISGGENITRKRGRYRKDASELFDPKLPPKAEANLQTKKLTPRVSIDHFEAFAKAAEQFPDKRAALERAVELLAAESGVELTSE